MTARYLVGDVFERMAEMPDGSVDLVLTSPPFLALRSYLPDDHPDKVREIGSEPTPAEFVYTLLRLTAEWRRVLAPHGSIAVELGDTYSGSGGAGGDYDADGLRDRQPRFRQSRPNTSHRLRPDGSVATDARVRATESKNVTHVTPYPGGDGWPEAKSLAMVPELYRVALAYGIHPLTGDPSPAGRWRVRNVVRWVRPNPPVGALGDKYRPASSTIAIACTSKSRFFDLDAVRQPPSPNTHARVARGAVGRTDLPSQQRDGNWHTLDQNNDAHPAGAPPLDWWKITSSGYSGAHYATWPSELCVIPIKSMCPQWVCRICGVPAVPANEYMGEALTAGCKCAAGHCSADYGCDDHWRSGVVLDPFAGSGTTLAVATGHGRDAIGIDIDERNVHLAIDRVGPLVLEVGS